MTDIQKDIIDWLHGQQDWLQEAAERLLNQGSLTDDDINEITDRLKTPEGQEITTHRPFSNIGGSSASSCDLRLCSIGDIEGIENLSPRSPLTFGEGNLTVIYGHNGSGKSGYTRILKKICGKPRALNLKPNVYKNEPVEGKCTIEYIYDGEKRSDIWMANSEPIECLKTIDIFDGDAVDSYLKSEAEVSYIPGIVYLFEKLAHTCDQIKEKLQNEQKHLVNRLPILPDSYHETEAGKIYLNLNQDVDVSGILEWKEEDQKRMNKLDELLKTKDPLNISSEKIRTKKQLDQIIMTIQKSVDCVSRDSIQSIIDLKKIAKDKREIAEIDAQKNTESALLDGFGKKAWTALWEAARTYSNDFAYPNHIFPHFEEDVRCVFCQQKLDDSAKKRLSDFDAYVQGKLETDARDAEANYQKIMGDLPIIPSESELITQCEAAGIGEKKYINHLKEFWKTVDDVCETLNPLETIKTIEGIDPPITLLSELIALSDILSEEIDQYTTLARQSNHDEARKQKVELDAKQWVSQQTEAIYDELRRIEDIIYLDICKKLSNSRKISLIAGNISERVITDAYIERFNQELSELRASNIKVELVKTGTTKGQMKHQIQLKSNKPQNEKPDSVLSDGERRMVILAAFFADVAANNNNTSLIFDDPISSLDHEYEWQVAQRFAKLAINRQVIIFTHRLSLLEAMKDAADMIQNDLKTPHIQKSYIESISGSMGHPSDEKFSNVNTTNANQLLIQRVDEAKKLWDKGDSDKYDIYAQSICSDFRKLIERTIEEDLLNRVVRRHSNKVTTRSRIQKLSKICKEDCVLFDDLITRYSIFEHSSSHEVPVDLPNAQEMHDDLHSLKKWREDFHKRPISG